MSEIKFRAWNESEKKFIYSNKHLSLFTFFRNIDRKNISILQQFTGLLDKNGKEIYESDLIVNLSRNNRKPHKVVYINAMFCGNYGSLNYPLWHETDEIEVIGNIYETPELLKNN